VLIVATAGTTGAGMIDPIHACRDIAREHGAWLHVDAAWAGAAIASERLRPALAGVETADSLTIDAHKWFATTMGCGMFMTRHPSVLSDAFQVSTSYMPSNLEQVDPYVTSLQWSRRFLGIRLFLSLAVAGWTGYGAHVERAVDLAQLLREELIDRNWRVVNASPVAVLCLEPPSGSPDPQTIVRRVLASGRAFVSAASFEARAVVRACVTHGTTSLEDIAILIDALEAARET
jgi:glutamate/tyrosine decarboxylase-like PLP-dependent enzyme